jgi:2-polyprenyl-3-methyl-5-hydroxy-6-metoxy-1,4-benzoquinol methylase
LDNHQTAATAMSDPDNYYRHERPELVALVSKAAPCVLDLGCGAGAMSAALKRERKVLESWGVELVAEMAEQARQNPALDRVLCGDLGDLVDELPEGHFSHIIAGDVLEHLVDPWTVLEGLRTRLAPGGLFICSLPNIRNFSFLAKLLFAGRFEYKDHGVMDRTHLRFFARKDIQLLFTGAGFCKVEIRPVRPKDRLHKKLARLLFGDLILKGFLVTASAD